MHDAHSQTPAPRLTEVRLYGHLRRRFGKTFHYQIRSGAEAVRALCVTVPGFRQYLMQHSAPGYRVLLGADPVTDVNQLAYPAGRVVRIVPVTAGAKGGFGTVLLGAALIGLSMSGFLSATPLITGVAGSSLASMAFSVGFGLVLGGVSQMLAGSPKTETPSERPNNAPSYAFNGAINTVAQGNPVPVLIGRLRVGSQVISTGLSTAPIA